MMSVLVRYESFATVGEIRVYRRADFQSGSRVQGCISCGMCSYPELTKDHVLTSAYVYIFRTVTRNAVNKSV